MTGAREPAVRPYHPADCEDVLRVWEAASVQAHPFLDADFLVTERQDIRTVYLPQAETWVWADGGTVLGFVSLLGSEVGALFVDPAHQRRGIGRALLDHARSLRGTLEVEVFYDNRIGRSFYREYGFEPVAELVHQATGRRLLRLRAFGPHIDPELP